MSGTYDPWHMVMGILGRGIKGDDVKVFIVKVGVLGMGCTQDKDENFERYDGKLY